MEYIYIKYRDMVNPAYGGGTPGAKHDEKFYHLNDGKLEPLYAKIEEYKPLTKEKIKELKEIISF